MKRLIINQDNALWLLQDILHSRQKCTVLVICSSRGQFLRQLASSLSAIQPVQAGDPEENNETRGNIQLYPLLVPTLQLLSTSKGIKLTFCPTINTLRAYLSTFATPNEAKTRPAASLLIVDLVALHHATSEFSVQGLMRSFASAVEAAAKNRMDLRLCECKDVHDLQNPDRGPRLWDAQVPLLSGSVRMTGDDAGWSRRVVSVRSVAGRWLEFEKLAPPTNNEEEEEEDDDEVLEGEEMLV